MIKLLNLEEKMVVDFKNELINELNDFYASEEEFDYVYEDSLKSIDSLFKDKDSKLIGYVKNNKIIILTKIFEAEDKSSKDNWLLKSFEGMISNIFYKYSDYEEIQEDIKDFFTFMSESYPNILLYTYNLNYSYFSHAYKHLSLQSTLSIDEEVVLDGDYVISNSCTINVLDELTKKQQIKQIKNLDSFIINAENEEQFSSFKKELSLLLTTVKPGGTVSFDGFSYFNPRDVFNYHKPKNLNYLIVRATFEDDTKAIVGVLKIADYSFTADKYYIGLNYINVHKSYYRKGIAKKLYECLNSYLNDLKIKSGEEPVFISSKLSDMGEKVGIDKTRNRIIKSVRTFNNIREYTLYVSEKQPN